MFVVHRLGDSGLFQVSKFRNVRFEDFEEAYDYAIESLALQSEGSVLEVCGINILDDKFFKKDLRLLQKASRRMLFDILGAEFTDAFNEGLQDRDEPRLPKEVEEVLQESYEIDMNTNELLARAEIYHVKDAVLACIRRNREEFLELIEIFRHYGRYAGMQSRSDAFE